VESGKEALMLKNTSLPVQSPFIMLIDDSPTVRKIVETCLGRAAFEVKSFPDGVEAIRWLTGPYSRIPNLVLLDIGLPQMNGYAVARLLKRMPACANTVMIMCSGRDGVIDKLKAHLIGAKAYITKPLKAQYVVEIVRSSLGMPSQE
jgi:twitching motility two-component system response regulator PilG